MIRRRIWKALPRVERFLQRLLGIQATGETVPLGGGPDEEHDVPKCPGPLLWFDVSESRSETSAGVLECAASGCGYVVMTGTPNDARHQDTPLLREGLA